MFGMGTGVSLSLKTQPNQVLATVYRRCSRTIQIGILQLPPGTRNSTTESLVLPGRESTTIIKPHG